MPGVALAGPDGGMPPAASEVTEGGVSTKSRQPSDRASIPRPARRTLTVLLGDNVEQLGG